MELVCWNCGRKHDPELVALLEAWHLFFHIIVDYYEHGCQGFSGTED
jgi:hypothetical protein